MLKDPSLNVADRQNVIRSIQVNTMALSKLVNNILDSARLEAGAVKLEKEVIDASDIVNQLEKVIEPLVLAKNMRPYFKTAEGAPLFMADEDKLLHILENLCTNAIKYSDEGGSIWVEAYWNREDDTMRFDVSDEGVGISEEDQRIIFQKFMQAESAIARPVSGSGLGLSLAREYAELHGGTIEVQSKKGEGSVFRVIIPLREARFRLRLRGRWAGGIMAKILIADDEQSIRNAVGFYMRQRGARSCGCGRWRRGAPCF